MHRNPLVRQVASQTLAGHPRIHLVGRLDYVSFLHAQRKSYLVATDSGGVQEAAPTFGKPVLVFRETTERPEGIEASVARLVGTDPAAVYAASRELLDDPAAYARMATATAGGTAANPYGDGHTARCIVDALLHRPTPSVTAIR